MGLQLPLKASSFPRLKGSGTVSPNQSSSALLGAVGLYMARRKMLCEELRYGDSRSDGGIGIRGGCLGGHFADLENAM